MRHLRWLSFLLLLLAAGQLLAASPPPQIARGGMVAADSLLASEAGAEMLRAGGNAVDAAIAAALSSGVVQPAGSGLGGGGFALVVAGQERSALDFREVAPAAATKGMFLDAAGEVIPKASTVGGLAVAVPSEARGLAELHRRYGSLPLKTLAEPAFRQAKKGFAVGYHLARSIRDFPTLSMGLFGQEAVPQQGETVRRRKLASALRVWVKTGGQGFNEGDVAQDIVEAVQASKGVITLEDLAAQQPKDREVVVGRYRGYTVVSFPPPSSGGAVLIQALMALEGWNLKELGHNSSAHVHLLAEVFQHAYADRARFMGDPDFTPVPLDQFLSPRRIQEIRDSFSPTQTFPRDLYGSPVQPPEDAGTLHISVLDAQGMAVALTTTINTPFGSGVVTPRYGILLNNEMDDFVARPGVPNSFGLIGLESNAIVPGKRPLSSMTPTVLLNDQGEVVMVVGGSGGSTIISATLQVISNILDFGMDPSQAVSAPRMHHQWVPEQISLDDGYPVDVVTNLEAMGHKVRVSTAFSAVQVISVKDGMMYAASDPRKGGQPAGVP